MTDIVEWRVFAEEKDLKDLDLAESVDAAIKSVIPTVPGTRSDVYIVASPAIGIKHRGGKAKLEIKMRTAAHAEDFGGLSEIWHKVGLGKGASLAVAEQHLKEQDLLTPALAARLENPVEVLITKEIRKGERPLAAGCLVLEKSQLNVTCSDPRAQAAGHAEKWVTYSVEGARADVREFVLAGGKALQELVKHSKAVVGGYPTFCTVIAGLE